MAPRNRLKMQILKSRFRPTDSETLGVGPEISVLRDPLPHVIPMQET